MWFLPPPVHNFQTTELNKISLNCIRSVIFSYIYILFKLTSITLIHGLLKLKINSFIVHLIYYINLNNLKKNTKYSISGPDVSVICITSPNHDEYSFSDIMLRLLVDCNQALFKCMKCTCGLVYKIYQLLFQRENKINVDNFSKHVQRVHHFCSN